jgi:hypothetical protein
MMTLNNHVEIISFRLYPGYFECEEFICKAFKGAALPISYRLEEHG